MDRNEGDNMPIPIYQFIKDVEKRRIKGLEVLVDLDTLKTFYPAEMRLKNRPKKAMLVEDPRSRFNGEFWEVYPIATTPTQVYIVCPFCKTIHVHGNVAGDYEGYREPHCHGLHGDGYYFIKKASEH